MTKEKIFITRAPRNSQHPYMQLYRKVPQDLNLTLTERGLLIYILSLPESWMTNIVDMGNKNGIGRNKTREIVNNLKKHGYCEAIKRKDENGRYAFTEYRFYEEKIETQDVDNEQSDPEPENQNVADNEYEPAPENRGLVSGSWISVSGSPGKNAENSDVSIYTLDKTYKRKDIPPIPPKGEDPKGSERDLNSSCNEEIKAATEEFIECIKKHKPDYTPPRKKDAWHQAMRKTIEQDKRSLTAVIKVLDWALQDNEIRGDWNGWASKVLISKNPIEYLRKKYDGLEMQSRATKYVKKHHLATQTGADLLRRKFEQSRQGGF